MHVIDSRGFFVRAAYGVLGPAPLALYRVAALPAAAAYGLAMWLRRRAYHGSLARIHSMGAPAFSVGNITAGGTGKTPMVEWLVRWLIEHGKRPAVLSRGYGAKAGSGGANDEAAMLSRSLPDVAHYADPDRVRGGRKAVDEGADCLVLDDGFQHLRAARDVNIVLVDSLDPFGGRRLLPAGTLREPLSALADADAVVLTRTDLVDADALEALRETVRRLAPDTIVCETQHEPVGLVDVGGGDTAPPEELADRRVAVFCGIGNPHGFLKTVQALGAHVVAARFLPDHFDYDERTLRQIAAECAQDGADAVVTTAKDAVKIGARWPGPVPLKALHANIVFTSGREKLEVLLKDALAS